MHAVLKPGGLLYVGHSENFTDARDLFQLRALGSVDVHAESRAGHRIGVACAGGEVFAIVGRCLNHGGRAGKSHNANPDTAR